MPEDEQTAAQSAAGSQPADGGADEPSREGSGSAKLGRVPRAEDELQRRPRPVPGVAVPPPRARSVKSKRSSGRSDSAPAPSLPRARGRRLLPVLGFGLLAGCLYGLLNGGSIQWLTKPTFAPGPGAGGEVVVVIDPGHGGADSGAIAQGVVEKDLNLDVGLRVARVLETAGCRVKLTREDDHFVPLETRVEIANALPAAIFVSIHFNDAQGEGRAAVSRASGIETYYSGGKQLAPAPDLMWTSFFRRAQPAAKPAAASAVAAGALLADSIQRALIAHTAAADRGIKEAGLYVTRRVRGPAVLVEGGFVSHPQEARLLQDPEYRQRIANSIAEGIVKFMVSAPPAAGASPAPRVNTSAQSTSHITCASR